MSDTQSLANQLGWCITTKDYLNDLTREVRYVSGRYESMVDMLASHRYLEEFLPEMQAMLAEFQDSANDLILHVEWEHLAYIEVQSKALRDALSQ